MALALHSAFPDLVVTSILNSLVVAGLSKDLDGVAAGIVLSVIDRSDPDATAAAWNPNPVVHDLYLSRNPATAAITVVMHDWRRADDSALRTMMATPHGKIDIQAKLLAAAALSEAKVDPLSIDLRNCAQHKQGGEKTH